MKNAVSKEEILEVIAFYDRLTIQQIMRIFGYSDGSYTYISTRLKSLVTQEYLTTRDVLLQKSFGGVTRVFSLTAKGYRLIDQEPRRRTKQAGADEEGSTVKMRHILAVNDLLISAKLWEQNGQNIKLTNALTEADIDRGYLATNVDYKPDGFIEGYRNGVYFALAPEIERKRYSHARWEEKLTKMLTFTAAFETPDALTFPIFTCEGDDHRKQLLMWTAEILRRFEREDAAGKFRITAVDTAEHRLFSEPVFYIPGVYKPVCLIEG